MPQIYFFFVFFLDILIDLGGSFYWNSIDRQNAPLTQRESFLMILV